MWRSAANPLAAVAAVNQRDRWTDRRTHDSYTDPALHTGSVINLHSLQQNSHFNVAQKPVGELAVVSRTWE